MFLICNHPGETNCGTDVMFVCVCVHKSVHTLIDTHTHTHYLFQTNISYILIVAMRYRYSKVYVSTVDLNISPAGMVKKYRRHRIDILNNMRLTLAFTLLTHHF